MKVLSLFDGISCARVALEKANLPVEIYHASEIDKYAIKISEKNYPDIKHIGNVKDVSSVDFTVDLLIGGSPCQDLSIQKQGRKGLEGDRSSLFWEYVRIKELCKPKWFILENVASMSKYDKDIITKAMGVEPIMINASLVSAQSRKRLFWTNIPNIIQPIDRNIRLKDIVQPETIIDNEMITSDGKAFTLTASYHNGSDEKRIKQFKTRTHVFTANDKTIRKLYPVECERLQGLSDDYTSGVSNMQRYKCLGNAFNVDVVAHILSHIKE
jgi:DNA (cytosine-5)-methyltransferase 3A